MSASETAATSPPAAPVPVAVPMGDASSPPPNTETVKLLCDLGTKRHDLAERSYDALNTRLAALFAFNTFLVPASIGSIRAAVTVTQERSVPPIHGWPRLAVISVWCVSLATVGVTCAWGYIARRVKSLPNPLALYRTFGGSPVTDTALQVLANMDNAWDGYRRAVRFKARCLNVAIVGILVEVALLLVTVLSSL